MIDNIVRDSGNIINMNMQPNFVESTRFICNGQEGMLATKTELDNRNVPTIDMQIIRYSSIAEYENELYKDSNIEQIKESKSPSYKSTKSISKKTPIRNTSLEHVTDCKSKVTIEQETTSLIKIDDSLSSNLIKTKHGSVETRQNSIKSGQGSAKTNSIHRKKEKQKSPMKKSHKKTTTQSKVSSEGNSDSRHQSIASKSNLNNFRTRTTSKQGSRSRSRKKKKQKHLSKIINNNSSHNLSKELIDVETEVKLLGQCSVQDMRINCESEIKISVSIDKNEKPIEQKELFPIETIKTPKKKNSDGFYLYSRTSTIQPVPQLQRKSNQTLDTVLKSTNLTHQSNSKFLEKSMRAESQSGRKIEFPGRKNSGSEFTSGNNRENNLNEMTKIKDQQNLFTNKLKQNINKGSNKKINMASKRYDRVRLYSQNLKKRNNLRYSNNEPEIPNKQFQPKVIKYHDLKLAQQQNNQNSLNTFNEDFDMNNMSSSDKIQITTSKRAIETTGHHHSIQKLNPNRPDSIQGSMTFKINNSNRNSKRKMPEKNYSEKAKDIMKNKFGIDTDNYHRFNYNDSEISEEPTSANRFNKLNKNRNTQKQEVSINGLEQAISINKKAKYEYGSKQNLMVELADDSIRDNRHHKTLSQVQMNKDQSDKEKNKQSNLSIEKTGTSKHPEEDMFHQSPKSEAVKLWVDHVLTNEKTNDLSIFITSNNLTSTKKKRYVSAMNRECNTPRSRVTKNSTRMASEVDMNQAPKDKDYYSRSKTNRSAFSSISNSYDIQITEKDYIEGDLVLSKASSKNSTRLSTKVRNNFRRSQEFDLRKGIDAHLKRQGLKPLKEYIKSETNYPNKKGNNKAVIIPNNKKKKYFYFLDKNIVSRKKVNKKYTNNLDLTHPSYRMKVSKTDVDRKQPMLPLTFEICNTDISTH